MFDERIQSYKFCTFLFPPLQGINPCGGPNYGNEYLAAWFMVCGLKMEKQHMCPVL